MRFDEFSNVTQAHWRTYLDLLQRNFDCLESPGVPLFPRQIFLFETKTHFGFELVGASRQPTAIKKRKRKCPTTRDIFNLFSRDTSDEGELFKISAKGCSLNGICLAHEGAISKAADRFPIAEAFGTTLIRGNGQEPLVNLEASADQFVISNCLLLQSFSEAIRCKRIVFMALVRRSTSKRSYMDFLAGLHWWEQQHVAPGVFAVKPGNEELELMSQLQSLFLSSGVHETSIGEFLELHPEIIERSFNTGKFVYEPYLKWLQHDGSVEDAAINPDLLVKRPDGFYDIVDLKLAGLKYRKLTKGQRRRRRFVDYVNEGLAQLANYDSYFSFPENAAYAKDKYGVEVSEPRLFLVVGSSENVIGKEVGEAFRMFSGNRFGIVDWDTLASVFLHSD